jgi:hypothetical protein
VNEECVWDTDSSLYAKDTLEFEETGAAPKVVRFKSLLPLCCLPLCC